MNVPNPGQGVGQGVYGILKERGLEPTKENVASVIAELMGLKNIVNNKKK